MSPRISKKFFFYVDVISACNLKCPSCPVGNSSDVAYSKGVMAPEFLDKIIAKAEEECMIDGFGLYNWTEPMLHPRLAELIRVVHSHRVPCWVSANLNLAKNLDAVMRENPELFCVSLSGFSQETYEITHKGGRIEKVKANMIEVARLKREIGATTHLKVAYHRYRSNLHEENAMREFAVGLGFEFAPMWAVLMPLEKVLGHRNEAGYAPPTPQDRELIERLALPLDGALDAAERIKNRRCGLLEDQITLDVEGNVQLCCAVYDPSRFTIANFLDTPLERIQEIRYAGSTCATCMKHGAHDYYTGKVPDADRLVRDNIARRQSVT